MMELAPYLFNHKPGVFEEMISLLHDLQYSAFDINTHRELPLVVSKLTQLRSEGGSRNIL